jgi:hypothetical protein
MSVAEPENCAVRSGRRLRLLSRSITISSINHGQIVAAAAYFWSHLLSMIRVSLVFLK